VLITTTRTPALLTRGQRRRATLSNDRTDPHTTAAAAATTYISQGSTLGDQTEPHTTVPTATTTHVPDRSSR
jgi:hypothetical protein